MVRNTVNSHWEPFRKVRDKYTESIRTSKQSICGPSVARSKLKWSQIVLSRNSQAILGSIKRPDGSFSETVEQTHYLVMVYFPGFIAETKDANLNKEVKGVLGYTDIPRTRCEDRKERRLAFEVNLSKQTEMDVKTSSPFHRARIVSYREQERSNP